MKLSPLPAFALALGVCLSGCSTSFIEELPETFEPNLVHAMKYEIQNDFSMDEASKDADWVVAHW